MAAYGKAQHGKEETRKEMALLAMAHRNVFVLQSSQASPAHMLGGVLKGLQSRYPAVFALHCPCPPEHGLGDDQAPDAAKLSLESRAYPLMQYDPAEGTTLAERLSLDGNPSVGDTWPEYDLTYLDEEGNEQTKTLPVTIADWAATEVRFRKHFTKVKPDALEDELVPFHEFIARPLDDREGVTPFIYVLERDKTLGRLLVSAEMVELTEDRIHVWNLLKEMAGEAEVEAGDVADFQQEAAQIRAEYEAKIADLKKKFPQVIARRLAEGLVRAGNGQQTVADLLSKVQGMEGLTPITTDMVAGFGAAAAPAAEPVPGGDGGTATAVAEAPAVAAAPAVEEEELALEPYIDTARCTTCDECTKLNKKMFAYNEKKQAYIKDPKAGTFKELVMAAERCPVRIIHPGNPLNKKEKDLKKWMKRAEPFN
jgi:pyruvate-ferredoxin/flavodoxin oxidoreductase